jgi:hypothetical protein
MVRLRARIGKAANPPRPLAIRKSCWMKFLELMTPWAARSFVSTLLRSVRTVSILSVFRIGCAEANNSASRDSIEAISNATIDSVATSSRGFLRKPLVLDGFDRLDRKRPSAQKPGYLNNAAAPVGNARVRAMRVRKCRRILALPKILQSFVQRRQVEQSLMEEFPEPFEPTLGVVPCEDLLV